MNLKIRLQNRKLWRRVRKLLHELTDQEIKETLAIGGDLDTAIGKIEEIMDSEKEELKFFKDYFGYKF